MYIRHAALAALFALPLVACEHDHGDAEAVDQVAEGCKHLEFGPTIELTLEPSDPPTIETFHTRYDMTLAAEADAYAGRLDYTSAGGMHYLIFDQDFDFSMSDADGAAVEATSIEDDPPSCELAQVVHHVMLPAGTYTFRFDGVPTELLQMVVHVAGQDHSH